MSNLDLWNSVSKTDPKYTKPAKLNGMQITAISPNSQKMKATEAFGPFGKGWGIVIDSEEFSTITIGDTTLLQYKAVLFYIHNGERGEFPIRATEKLSYKVQSKGYMKVDDDADKKVVTNAITKGLSELGFNADIFLGDFDNFEYRQMREMEENLAKAENFELEQKSGFNDVLVWLNSEIGTFSSFRHASVLTTVHDNIKQKLVTKMQILKATQDQYNNYENKLSNAYQEQLNKLSNQ